MILINIAGGVALTLFGVRFLRKGLDRLFGGSLARWVEAMTSHRLKAFGAGIAVGTVAPSSTGLALITVQMLKAGRLGPVRVLAVLLGAGVGVTVTVQLLAFPIHSYAPLLLVAGVGLFQFTHRETLRGIGQCLSALGFVFLAMGLISYGGADLAENPETRQWAVLLEGHPWFVALVAAGLAVMLQSSTATIGLGFGLIAGGILSAALAIPLVVGTNVGLAVTSLFAGWHSAEGRQLGFANLLIKALAAIPLLVFSVWAVRSYALLPGTALRQLALFHTAFNLIPGLFALPWLGPITRFAGWLMASVTPSPNLMVGRATHLDERALDTPSLALVHATRETLRQADETKAMLEAYWRAEAAPASPAIRVVQLQDDRIDAYHREIRNYLSRIGETMTTAENRWQFTLLGFSNELEAVGDIIDKHLCDALLKRMVEHVALTVDDRAALAGLYRDVAARFDDALLLLTTRDAGQARAVLVAKEVIAERARAEQTAHYRRLQSGDAGALASSSYFLDALNSLRRINSHVSNLAYAFLPPGAPASSIPARS